MTATLERFLDLAKKGELRSVLVVGVVIDHDGEASIFECSTSKRTWRDALLGGIERAKWVCLDTWTKA